jgi:hypothetical protein
MSCKIAGRFLSTSFVAVAKDISSCAADSKDLSNYRSI